MNLNQSCYIEKREGSCRLSLDGTWKFGYAEQATNRPRQLSYPYEAAIPDSLFWNLYECGRLPHPYKGMNSRFYGWVDEKVWYYKKTFQVDESLKGRLAVLCFDGAAYYSRIWLNGTLLGEHEGMFGGPYIAVSPLLNYGGENELLVEIRACNYGKKENYDGRNLKGENREIVPWNTARDDHTSNGDWIILGLWRSVRLEFLSPFHLGRPYLVTKNLGEGFARLRLETEIIGPEYDELHPPYAIHDNDFQYTFAYSPGLRQAVKNLPASLSVRLVEKSSGICAYEAEYPVELLDYARSLRARDYPESQYFEKEFDLPGPRLWWPHDMGEPFLYRAEICLKVDGDICDTLAFSFGVRTIEMKQTPGPRTRLHWDKYQFVVNGKSLFLKGVNWMPQDALYREDEQEYQWSLELAKNAGIHLIRVWSGGGKPEADAFYDKCDELGIMVWQDHFIANTSHTEGWPQEILECQESVNLYRIRNHPSLAVHCGGNEFNVWSAGNAAAMFVIQRTLEDLDPSRKFYYTTPAKGSAHIYNDMEPTWYRHLYKDLPFAGETGIHSLPNYKAMKQFLSKKECTQQVPDLTSEKFRLEFPEFLNHFTEYIPERVPRMLARASQITDLEHTDLKGLIEASQAASCEYYEILIQALRENYPVTAGVMPWVFRRTWPTAGIQLVDGTGEPIAPYYYLKNAYQNIEVHLALEQISFAPGEDVRIPVCICNEYGAPLTGYTAEIRAWSPEMRLLLNECMPAEEADGKIFTLHTEQEWADQFFFLTAALYRNGRLVMRQPYWPKCLRLLENPETLKKYRDSPQGNFHLKAGPWLKKQIQCCSGAKLEAKIISKQKKRHRVKAEIQIANTGSAPAFPVILQIREPEARLMASDNWFWLETGEKRTLFFEADAPKGMPECLHLEWKAWNAAPLTCRI